jgi:hypothetical protein
MRSGAGGSAQHQCWTRARQGRVTICGFGITISLRSGHPTRSDARPGRFECDQRSAVALPRRRRGRSNRVAEASDRPRRGRGRAGACEGGRAHAGRVSDQLGGLACGLVRVSCDLCIASSPSRSGSLSALTTRSQNVHASAGTYVRDAELTRQSRSARRRR